MSRRSMGMYFENKALLYLAHNGYKLIESNFHAGRESEIDIIMFDGTFIVFVEVKSLRYGSTYSLYESITPKKKRFIKKGVQSWLLRHNHVKSPWRVDFVGIMYKNLYNYKITHIPLIEL